VRVGIDACKLAELLRIDPALGRLPPDNPVDAVLRQRRVIKRQSEGVDSESVPVDARMPALAGGANAY
jgi:hypothetical protein